MPSKIIRHRQLDVCLLDAPAGIVRLLVFSRSMRLAVHELAVVQMSRYCYSRCADSRRADVAAVVEASLQAVVAAAAAAAVAEDTLVRLLRSWQTLSTSGKTEMSHTYWFAA